MKICLISAVHVWVNPRLVKEADLLVERGHSVTVITIANDDWSEERDRELLKTKKWTVKKVVLLKSTLAGRVRWIYAALRQKLFFNLSGIFPKSLRFAAEACYRGYWLALKWALEEKADFYIAHTQAALAIAMRAAGAGGKGFGFDCEDLNALAQADGARHPQVARNIKKIEASCLEKAQYVTATSTAMAEFLVSSYGIAQPIVIHNVFSLKETAILLPPDKRSAHSEKISLVWMSATIGKGRGLEMVLTAMKKSLPDCELTVCGRFLDLKFQKKIEGLVKKGLTERVYFKKLAMPAEVFKELSRHDIGLALEDGSCLNLALTVTNKYFLYLQSGLALAVSDVPGQRSVWKEHPETGFIFPPNDVHAFAVGIREFCVDRKKLLETKQSTWKLGLETYNWEKESRGWFSMLKNEMEKKNL